MTRDTLTHKEYTIHDADYKKLTSCFIRKSLDESPMVHSSKLTDPEETRVEEDFRDVLLWAADFAPNKDHIKLTAIMLDVRWDWNLNRHIVSKIEACGAQVDGFKYAS